MRTYKRKTSRNSHSPQNLNAAAKAVNDEGKSVNAAAKEFGIKRMTLTRFLKKLMEGGDSSMGYATPRQVFRYSYARGLIKDILTLMTIR